MVVIAKNGSPKVFKELLAAIKGVKIDGMRMSHASKIHGKSHLYIETSHLIFKTNQLAGFYMDGSIFR